MEKERMKLEFEEVKSIKELTMLQWVHSILTVVVFVGTGVVLISGRREVLMGLGIVAIVCCCTFVS